MSIYNSNIDIAGGITRTPPRKRLQSPMEFNKIANYYRRMRGIFRTCYFRVAEEEEKNEEREKDEHSAKGSWSRRTIHTEEDPQVVREIYKRESTFGARRLEHPPLGLTMRDD